MKMAEVFFTPDRKNAIRNADMKGKRTIEFDDRKFLIERYSRNVSFQTGGTLGRTGAREGAKTVKRTEHWLRCKPADGSLVPICVIERYKDSKPRSAHVAS